MGRTFHSRWALTAIPTSLCWGLGGTSVYAQESVVSACSGVSLPPSVVTDIMAPVITGVVVPVEGVVNPLLSAVDLLSVLPLPAPLSIDASGLLATAASGAPITLSVLDVDGVIVGPSDECVATSDAVALDTEKGVSIGGNRITGLGENGMEADAGELNSIALGNNAVTDATAAGAIAIGQAAEVQAGATGSIAFGQGATASEANSVALGANSLTTGSLGSPGLQSRRRRHRRRDCIRRSVDRQRHRVSPAHKSRGGCRRHRCRQYRAAQGGGRQDHRHGRLGASLRHASPRIW